MGYTVRTTKYRYTAWVTTTTGEVVAKEFYDIVNDPVESVNVADDKSFATVVNEAEEIWRKSWTPVRDDVR